MSELQKIALAGGCFWGTERYFQLLHGVRDTTVGYANGPSDHTPSYEEVKHGIGHAETVMVTFDPDMISLSELLTQYFSIVDPLSVNQQGHDIGIQYRTGIYYMDETQLPVIREAMKALENMLGEKPAIEIAPLDCFFTAEEYHQDYLIKNPQGYCHLPSSKFEEAKAYGRS
ncbi:MAG: peptide-methionine (S)-S-oxide reductase MsrA [Clostridia bacterium]|nr:peptide-methionine (S)-S-oxide reductase MsrA [Clostridia bacterium]